MGTTLQSTAEPPRPSGHRRTGIDKIYCLLTYESRVLLCSENLQGNWSTAASSVREAFAQQRSRHDEDRRCARGEASHA